MQPIQNHNRTSDAQSRWSQPCYNSVCHKIMIYFNLLSGSFHKKYLKNIHGKLESSNQKGKLKSSNAELICTLCPCDRYVDMSPQCPWTWSSPYFHNCGAWSSHLCAQCLNVAYITNWRRQGPSTTMEPVTGHVKFISTSWPWSTFAILF